MMAGNRNTTVLGGAPDHLLGQTVKNTVEVLVLRLACLHSLQVSIGGAAGIRALPSFWTRRQVQDLAMHL